MCFGLMRVRTHRGRCTDFRKFHLRIRGCAETSNEKRCLRSQCVPDGQSFQPGCALALGRVVYDRLLHRLHPRGLFLFFSIHRLGNLIATADFGEDYNRDATAMSEFDPDAEWTRVEQ
jgi:hypothetical protein